MYQYYGKSERDCSEHMKINISVNTSFPVSLGTSFLINIWGGIFLNSFEVNTLKNPFFSNIIMTGTVI